MSEVLRKIGISMALSASVLGCGNETPDVSLEMTAVRDAEVFTSDSAYSAETAAAEGVILVGEKVVAFCLGASDRDHQWVGIEGDGTRYVSIFERVNGSREFSFEAKSGQVSLDAARSLPSCEE
ncbi:hypothetical protein KA047_00255 [Candidatus Saccharibacteria bacterium]|nr:hypothetical protein [Candidatus Saccharibacteria bacterium]